MGEKDELLQSSDECDNGTFPDDLPHKPNIFLSAKAPWLTLVMLNSFVWVYGVIQVSMFMLVLPRECAVLFPGEEAVGLASMLGIAGMSQLVSPAAGLFSDRMSSPFGRRRPFIVGGSSLALVGLYILWFLSKEFREAGISDRSISDSQTLYITAFFVVNVGLNICFAAYSGLIPDLVQSSELGRASGIMGVMSASGALLGVYSIGFLDREPFSLYIGCLILVVVVTLLFVNETPISSPPETIVLRDVFHVYFESLKDPDFFWVWVSRLLYYMGVSVQVFMQYFIRDCFHISLEDARTATAVTSMITLASSASIAAPCGILSDSYNRTPIVYFSCVLMITVYAGWVAAFELWHIFAWSFLYGVANGAYLSVDYALACDTLPDREEHAAQALGVWGVAAFIGSTLGPVFSGPLLYALGSTDESDVYSHNGYAALLACGALLLILSALALSKLSKDY